jgi:uncharacterized membrane protein YuzA (DUF378 family)
MGYDLLRLSVILLVIGGLNCGSIGLMGKDFISSTLGRGTAAKVLHIAIGLAAVYVGLRSFGFIEGYANNNMNGANMNGANMNGANMNGAMNEGFAACKDGKDEKGNNCSA